MKYETSLLPGASYLVALQLAAVTAIISIASFASCALFVAYYAQANPALRDTLRFATGALAITVGIISTAYIGYKLTVSALEEKNNRTLAYISRWSAGQLPKSRPTQILTAAFNRLENKVEYVKSELEDDSTRRDVVEILCFLEEMALVVERTKI